jgi:hypothetical protein
VRFHSQRASQADALSDSRAAHVALRLSSVVMQLTESVARYQRSAAVQFADVMFASVRQAPQAQAEAIRFQQASMIQGVAEDMVAHFRRALRTAQFTDVVLAPVRRALQSQAAQLQHMEDAAASMRGGLPLAELRVGQAPGHRHPLGGSNQVQLQSPVPAGMRSAVAVVRPPGQLRAPDRLPGGAARHRSGIDQPQVIGQDGHNVAR